MKLYSFNSKGIRESSFSKDADPGIDIYAISKQAESKSNHNKSLLLRGISLFLLGAYFFAASMFLYSSLGISYKYKSLETLSTKEVSRLSEALAKKGDKTIRNLNSIPAFYYSKRIPDYLQNEFWVHSQVFKNKDAGAVWIHRIQVTFLMRDIQIPSNHFKTNFKTSLS